jgi:hypothetical protein
MLIRVDRIAFIARLTMVRWMRVGEAVMSGRRGRRVNDAVPAGRNGLWRGPFFGGV